MQTITNGDVPYQPKPMQIITWVKPPLPEAPLRIIMNEDVPYIPRL